MCLSVHKRLLMRTRVFLINRGVDADLVTGAGDGMFLGGEGVDKSIGLVEDREDLLQHNLLL